MSFRTMLLNASIPIQKLMQKMHPPEAQTTVQQAQRALLTMRSGDCLVSRQKWHFTNLFIPGFWSHCAIFGYIDDQPCVVEAVGSGVRVVPWCDWVIEMHNWAVMRPVNTSIEVSNDAFSWACEKIGDEYNYIFDPKAKGFWCSYLTWASWFCTYSSFTKECFKQRKTWGEWVVTPDDFYEAMKVGKFQKIHEWRDVG